MQKRNVTTVYDLCGSIVYSWLCFIRLHEKNVGSFLGKKISKNKTHKIRCYLTFVYNLYKPHSR